MTASYAFSPPSQNPWTCGTPAAWLDFNFRSNSKASRWFMVCTFSFHLLWILAGRISSQSYPGRHNSCKSILNLIATGSTRLVGSHNWSTRPKHRLFVRTSKWPSSFFFKVNLFVCLSQLRRSRSVCLSLLDWSISVWSECHALIRKWPSLRIVSMSLVICFAFAVVSLDPLISSTYTWS